jgi:GT2 family glycosyltransferase
LPEGETVCNRYHPSAVNGKRDIGGVSVVVCNYNGAEYIADCLDSILIQEGFDEVLVVDNASTDESLKLVRENYPTVRVLEMPENGGPCGARNAGLRAANHRFVLAVDNDTVLRPDVLTKLRAALQAEPDAIIAQVRSVIHNDPQRIHYDGANFHYVGLFSLRNFYSPLAKAEGRGVIEAQGLIAMCVLMDRDPVLAAGGYDEDFFYLAEDADLSYRLRLLGHRLLIVEDAIVLHRGGTQGLSFRGGGYPQRRAYLHSVNRWRMIAKCYSARTLVCILPGLLLYELIWLLFVIMKGHFKQHVQGKIDFMRARKIIMAQRRTIQGQRKVPDRELLVGGPLTLSPSLVESPLTSFFAGALNTALKLWWFVARPFCG